MKKLTLAAAVLVVTGLLALSGWRFNDQREMDLIWRALVATTHVSMTYEPAMVAHLPEAAQRYFNFVIRPGTPLNTVVEISMRGELSLGTKESHEYMPMKACQILAPAHGFVWRVSAGQGLMRFEGSDAAFSGESWTRFWLFGLLPVARVGGTPDHARSAYGRYIGEAVFWSPASLLPSPTVSWESVTKDTARVTVRHQELVQAVDVTVDAAGRPTTVKFERWSDANAENAYRLQPFGGTLSAFKEFGGFMLPTKVIAGNQFGTDEYFPFFKAQVDKIQILKNPADAKFCGARQ